MGSRKEIPIDNLNHSAEIRQVGHRFTLNSDKMEKKNFIIEFMDRLIAILVMLFLLAML